MKNSKIVTHRPLVSYDYNIESCLLASDLSI